MKLQIKPLCGALCFQDVSSDVIHILMFLSILSVYLFIHRNCVFKILILSPEGFCHFLVGQLCHFSI